MARLYEHQGKQLLKSVGIPVPRGEIASNPIEARRIAEELGRPVVLKAQVWTTGRMKAGGIMFASSPSEAEECARIIFGAEIKGFKVERVLVEEKLDIKRECYLGIVIDDSYKVKAPVIMLSTEGGIDIEEIAEKYPDRIAKKIINILEGVDENDFQDMVSYLNIDRKYLEDIGDIMVKFYKLFRKYHASSAEINPLVLTTDNKFFAADCRVSIDDSSVYLHPELNIKVARESEKPPTKLDEIAWRVEESDYRGVFYYMQLISEEEMIQGCIGFHGIGGGASIVGADALTRAGLKIANFADTSGNPTASKVYRCAKIILSQPGIEGYFLGGFCIASQEQWHHAHGLVKAFREELYNKPGFPVIIVIAGNKERESIKILREGLEDLPIKLEIYGRDHLDKADFLARRMKQLVEEYGGMKNE